MAEPYDDDPKHWHLDKRLNLSHIITTLAPVAAFSILEAQCKTDAPLVFESQHSDGAEVQ